MGMPVFEMLAMLLVDFHDLERPGLNRRHKDTQSEREQEKTKQFFHGIRFLILPRKLGLDPQLFGFQAVLQVRQHCPQISYSFFIPADTRWAHPQGVLPKSFFLRRSAAVPAAARSTT